MQDLDHLPVAAGHGLNIRLATWNTWLIPVLPSFPGCINTQVRQRSHRLCQWLRDELRLDHLEAGPSVDVLCLQEVWSDKSSLLCRLLDLFCCKSLFAYSTVREFLCSLGWHVSRCHGVGPCQIGLKFFDSGLLVASRFPILKEGFWQYTVSSADDNMLACKGVLVVALDCGLGADGLSRVLVVCNTHLDAGDAATAVKVKYPQLLEFLDYVKAFEEGLGASLLFLLMLFAGWSMILTLCGTGWWGALPRGTGMLTGA